jgi:hypothetical protein
MKRLLATPVIKNVDIKKLEEEGSTKSDTNSS